MVSSRPFGVRALTAAALVTCALLAACSPVPGRDAAPATVDGRCAWPGSPAVLHDEDGAVLLRWTVPDLDVFDRPVLPDHPALLAYRAAVVEAGADVRWPPFVVPSGLSDEEAGVWEGEAHNTQLVYGGEVGVLEPITCLDALLFAEQAGRRSQLESPTEFVASVLERSGPDGAERTVLFGAGLETFPPRAVYGGEETRRLTGAGWTYAYSLHNHTLRNGPEGPALGVPAPSTSDVQFGRALAADQGVGELRVTNGFHTVRVGAGELDRFRARDDRDG